MSPKDVRQHVTEIEIDATPDQVFRAITEAEGIKRWFAPEAKVEPGPDGNMAGGSYSVSWGPGMEGTPNKIAIWEPGQRFATEKLRSAAYGSEGKPEATAEMQRIIVDYQIEAAGGKTRLRLVHSGFGHGAEWDNEFEGTRTGWPVFLLTLKHGLERHPGVDNVTVSVTVPCAVTPDEAWRRLIGPAALRTGDRYSIPFAALEGTVMRFDPPRAFIGRVAELNDGLVGIYCGFYGKNVNVSMVLWGTAREQAKQIEAAWTELLKNALL
jgi:uncharacterized protein YndB with AHSA1/START domain